MRLDFCVACGARDALHHHHLVPRTEGGPDDDTNLITLCEDCHGRVHGRTFKHHRKLQRVGIERAIAEGSYKGRTEDVARNASIAMMLEMGASWSQVQRAMGCSRPTIAKVAKRPRPDFTASLVTRALQIPSGSV